jgi:hypothetical protein
VEAFCGTLSIDSPAVTERGSSPLFP